MNINIDIKQQSFDEQDKQECFIEQSDGHQESENLQSQFHLAISSETIKKQLPPNQLRNILRPQIMQARTFNDNKKFSLLPMILNHNDNLDSQTYYQQFQSAKTSSQGYLKVPSNKQKLSLQAFFNKKQFKQVYNKLNNCHSQRKSFTGKLREVDSVGDYNHKMFREIEQYHHHTKMDSQTIDSDFECGNMCRAFVKINQSSQYFLMIENDMNTHGYNIWFFFRFRNHKSKGVKTFNLMNLVKKTDNYKNGMQISVFSMKKHQSQQLKWHKSCKRLTFNETNFYRQFHQTEKYYHLSFQYDFQYQDDEVYFAMNKPYTYTRMIRHINGLNVNKMNQNLNIEIKIMGHSLADNVIPYVKIWTNEYETKQTILITARQHPCETVGSFICEEILNFLVSERIQVKMLFQKFQFIIIPMVNPDGVIHGSSRCNLAGFDLNRQWGTFLIKQFTPETHRIKKYLLQLHKQNNIKYFIDLHGHSKKLNSFIFSCKKGDRPSNRLLQLVMNKIQPNRFNVLDCTYGIDRDKQNTIRAQLFQMGVQSCYTLQTSLYGYVKQSGDICHYTEKDYKSIGESMIRSLFVVDNPSQCVKEVMQFSKEDILQTSISVIQKIVEKQKNQTKKYDNASDSDPDGDILDMKFRMETCCKNNSNLKKKISETLSKDKNYSKSNTKSSIKKHRKSSTLSAHNDEDIMSGAYLLSTQINGEFNKKNINKLSFQNKRTTIYSKKIKQKKEFVTSKSLKRSITQADQVMNKTSYNNDCNNQGSRELITNTEIKFWNKKFKDQLKNEKSLKTECSIIYKYPCSGMLYQFKNSRKKSQQFKSSNEIPGVVYEEDKNTENMLEKQTKFKQLRDESLKALLYDTFTILKNKPKLSVKRYVKLNIHERKKKHEKMLSQMQHLQTEDNEQHQEVRYFNEPQIFQQSSKRIRTQSCRQNKPQTITSRMASHRKQLQTRRSSKEQENKKSSSMDQRKRNGMDFKFKRFENFLYPEGSKLKYDHQKNSVFYYFPVL